MLELSNSSLKIPILLRDRYLLERDRIKNQIGNLSQILETLGVNQRRACQLLLVDPSAWTRWNKTEAPPHIYQALKWLVMLKKTNPNMFGSTDIENRIDLVHSSAQNKLKELERNVASLERALAYQPTSVLNLNDNAQINELFRAQEERFQKRILELETELRRLLAMQKTIRIPNLSKTKRSATKKFSSKTKTKRNLERKSKRARIRSIQKKNSRLKVVTSRVELLKGNF